MNPINKNDLEIFAEKILCNFEKLLDEKLQSKQLSKFNWLRSKEIRQMMNISPATLQNLRVTGKIRHKKIMGSYYYSSIDLQNLFENDQ